MYLNCNSADWTEKPSLMVCFHTVKEKDAKFKRFQFVCKEICNRISLCVCRPSTGKGISARRLQSNRLCERAIAQESLNTSYMKLSCKTIAFIGGVGGLIDDLTWWRHIRARYAQPPLQNLVCTPMGKTAIKWLLLLPVLVELRAALIVVSLCVLIWSKN